MTTGKISKLIRQTKKHVGCLFNQRKDKRFVYHNLAHTRSVAREAKKIAKYSRLSDQDYLILMLAAWFHDVGYFTNPVDHEQIGAREANQFLIAKKIDEAVIDDVRKAIYATTVPQQPETLVEKILCDADLSSLGKRKFTTVNRKLRKEQFLLTGRSVSKKQWRTETIDFLENHSYFTEYASAHYVKKKEKHLKRLRKKELVNQ